MCAMLQAGDIFAPYVSSSLQRPTETHLDHEGKFGLIWFILSKYPQCLWEKDMEKTEHADWDRLCWIWAE